MPQSLLDSPREASDEWTTAATTVATATATIARNKDNKDNNGRALRGAMSWLALALLLIC